MQPENSFDITLLSVIIPAFRQEKTIVKDIQKIESVLKTLGIAYEIIIVIDGMADNTYQMAKKITSIHVKVISYKANQGKGYAVKVGMSKASGDIVGFIDAGMDIDPNGMAMLLNHMRWYKADIIVGSKLHPVSRIHYPLWRKMLSRGYRLLTRILFGFKIRDTQVGMKFFRRRVAKDVFPRLLVKKFAFDIEILAVAYSLGYKRIYEAPVNIKLNNSSNITSKSFWTIVTSMLWDTMAVFYRVRILHYYKSKKALRDTQEIELL